MQDWTAAQLADALDGMRHHAHNTGGLSMLDEATLAFRFKYPNIAEPQQSFSAARHAHMRSYSTTGNYSQDAWDRAMAAAERLAAELRPLGDTRIARCKQTTGWGTCNLPLNDDGTCRMLAEHKD